MVSADRRREASRQRDHVHGSEADGRLILRTPERSILRPRLVIRRAARAQMDRQPLCPGFAVDTTTGRWVRTVALRPGRAPRPEPACARRSPPPPADSHLATPGRLGHARRAISCEDRAQRAAREEGSLAAPKRQQVSDRAGDADPGSNNDDQSTQQRDGERCRVQGHAVQRAGHASAWQRRPGPSTDCADLVGAASCPHRRQSLRFGASARHTALPDSPAPQTRFRHQWLP